MPEPVPLLASGDFGQKVGQLMIGQGRWPGPISTLMKTWGLGMWSRESLWQTKGARRGIKLEAGASQLKLVLLEARVKVEVR